MLQVAAELIIALTLSAVTLGLFLGRRRVKPRHLGYDLLLVGFCLVTFGACMDFFEPRAHFHPDSAAHQVLLFLELMWGYFLGLLFIAAGLTSWMSALIRYQEVTDARLRSEERLRAEKNLVQGLLDGAPGVIYMFDRDGRMLRWSRRFEEILGYTAEELRGLSALDTIDPRDRTAAADAIGRVFDEGRSGATVRILSKDGRSIPHFAAGASIDTEQGPCVVGMAVDISDRVEAEQALVESKRLADERNESLQLLNRLADRLHRTLRTVNIARETVDALVQMSQPPLVAFYLIEPGAERLYLAASHGFDDEARRIGTSLPITGSLSGIAVAARRLTYVGDIPRDERIEPRIKAKLTEEGIVSGLLIPLFYDELALGTINLVFKERREFDAAAQETFRAIGQTVALALANARHVRHLEHQALHDSLTGLPNRNFLHAEFERVIARKRGPATLALLLLDLDRFKEVNDTLGHHVGDRLLIQVGARARETLAHREAMVARLGGDEFAVLLWGVAGSEDAWAVADELRSALKQPLGVGGMALEIGTSVGVAVHPQHGVDSHELLRCADVAMYQAKQSSTGVALYHPALDPHTTERLAMMGELGIAIRENQLLLHFQPTLRLGDRRLMGFEALVRWQHPSLGLVPPDRFIPLAEMSDLIHPLTEWVTDHALAQLRRWQDQGLDVSMALNLSTRNLLDQGWAGRMEDLIRRHDVPPDRVELEITETALLGDPERALELLERIAAQGVRLSIDDFGTGYSSLSYLKRLPVTTLKIDRSFVWDMIENEQDRAIVRSTINLAHSLSLRVLAEGVENQATLDVLGTLGCDHAQGFHIAAPMEAAAVAGWREEAQERMGLLPH